MALTFNLVKYCKSQN